MSFRFLAFFLIYCISCSLNPGSDNHIQTPSETIIERETDEPEIIDQAITNNDLFLDFPSGVRCIFEDSKGNIWFGSHQEGVCLFDGSKLTYFTSEDGLSNNQVRSIYEDEKGTIWFETGKGISGYSQKKIFVQKDFDLDHKDDWKIGSKDIWFKGDEMVGFNRREARYGAYRYDGNSFYFHAFPIENKNVGWTYSISTPFVKRMDGTVWLGTYSAVFGFNGSNFTILDNESLGFDDQTGDLHVRSLFEDSNGTLWIGNNGIGVLRQDRTSYVSFSEEQGLISKNSGRSGGYQSPPGSLEHVFAISEDHDGNIWFGDRDTGAWRFDGNTTENFNEAAGLPVPFIWQIYPTKNGELWFALANGHVMKFNDSSFERIF